MLSIVIIASIGCIVAVFAIGVTLYDLRAIRHEQLYRKHPQANKWRRRPVITARIAHHLPTDTLQAFKRYYRKIEPMNAQETSSEYTLVVHRNVLLDKTTLVSAVRQLNADESILAIELVPLVSKPQTLGQFLQLYRISLGVLLMKSRAGWKVNPRQSMFLILKRQDASQHRMIDRAHIYLRHFVAFCTPIVLANAIYLALVAHHTELLLLCIVGFASLVTTALWSYQHMSYVHKAIYTLLLPATLGYFFILAWFRPLEMIANVAKAKVPVGVSLFVRIKDILRIV